MCAYVGNGHFSVFWDPGTPVSPLSLLQACNTMPIRVGVGGCSCWPQLRLRLLLPSGNGLLSVQVAFSTLWVKLDNA